MPANTSAASASCGTHFGLTKLVASTVRRPVVDRRSMSAILSAAGTCAASFCRPSRGPTSTMRTWAGMGISVLQGDEHGVGVDEIAFAGAQFGHHAVARGLERQLHLHRLHHQQLLALAYRVAGL